MFFPPQLNISNGATMFIRKTLTPDINFFGNRTGAGLIGTSSVGPILGIDLVDPDNTANTLGRIVGIGNRTLGPAGARGAEVVFEAGVGNITNAVDNSGTELPENFSITIGGFVFEKANVTLTVVATVEGVDYKTFVIGGGTDYFGGSATGLDPATPQRQPSTTYTIGDRVKSQLPAIDLVALVNGDTSDAAFQPFYGDFAGTVIAESFLGTGGTIQWNMVPAIDFIDAEIFWGAISPVAVNSATFTAPTNFIDHAGATAAARSSAETWSFFRFHVDSENYIEGSVTLTTAGANVATIGTGSQQYGTVNDGDTGMLMLFDPTGPTINATLEPHFSIVENVVISAKT